MPLRQSQIRVRHRANLERLNPVEAVRIAGIDRDVLGQGCGGNQRVIRPSRRLAAIRSQRSCHAAERTRRIGAERNRFKVGLGLLQVRLTRNSFSSRARDVRTDRQFSEGDRADHRVCRQYRRIREAAQQNDR